MRLTSFLFKKEGGKTRNKKEINRTDKRTTNKKKLDLDVPSSKQENLKI